MSSLAGFLLFISWKVTGWNLDCLGCLGYFVWVFSFLVGEGLWFVYLCMGVHLHTLGGQRVVLGPCSYHFSSYFWTGPLTEPLRAYLLARLVGQQAENPAPHPYFQTLGSQTCVTMPSLDYFILKDLKGKKTKNQKKLMSQWNLLVNPN